jgi:hypothetical protein
VFHKEGQRDRETKRQRERERETDRVPNDQFIIKRLSTPAATAAAAPSHIFIAHS